MVNDVHLSTLISHLWSCTHDHPIPPCRHSMVPFERGDIMENFIDGLKKKEIKVGTTSTFNGVNFLELLL